MRPIYFLLATCLIIASDFSRCAVVGHAQTGEDDKSINLVVILVDDLGWKDLGCCLLYTSDAADE